MMAAMSIPRPRWSGLSKEVRRCMPGEKPRFADQRLHLLSYVWNDNNNIRHVDGARRQSVQGHLIKTSREEVHNSELLVVS